MSSNSVDLAIIRSTINAHDAAVDINLSGPLTNNVSELELKYLASQLNGEMRHPYLTKGDVPVDFFLTCTNLVLAGRSEIRLEGPLNATVDLPIRLSRARQAIPLFYKR